MQNMNYYYDFSGQKFNHPLSLSINSFDRKVFSRQTSLELSYVLKGSYEVITEHISHSLTEQELAVIAPDEIHILKKLQPESVILTIHIDFERIQENMLGSCKNLFHTGLSFVKYLSYVRVRESLEDLLEGKASIEEISGKCGMPNSKAYSQIFKELYGITPSTYRKRFVKNLLPLPEQETRPMEFTQKQKELLTKVFHLDDTNRLLFHAEGIQIVSDGDTLLCTLSDARQKELLLSQKEDDIVLTIRPSCTGT